MKAEEIKEALELYKRIKSNVHGLGQAIASVKMEVQSPGAYCDHSSAEARAMFDEIYPNPLPVIRARLEAKLMGIKDAFPGVEFPS